MLFFRADHGLSEAFVASLKAEQNTFQENDALI
jgi:hypothetical protein